MRYVRRVRHALRSVFRREAVEHELDEELRFALDELAARHRARGLAPGAARRAALLEIGGIDQVKEEVREMRIGAALEIAWRDARLALRELAKIPVFSAAAVLTLALGIGGAVAIFTLVNALLLQPLPYRDADRLVFIWQDLTDAGYPRAPLAGPELNDLRERSTLFDGIGGIWGNTATLTGEGELEQLRIGLVTSNFFAVLGADAAIGRTFAAGDTEEASPASIVLSWPLFQRRFGGDRSIVGRRIEVNRRPTTVLGVMPEGFRLLFPPEASVPAELQAWQLLTRGFERGPRTQQYIRAIGRMKPGVDLRPAQDEIAAIGRQVGREFTDYGPSGATFYVVSLKDDGVRDVRPALLALFAGVGILLTIACVNVASLLVTRAASRRHETALRLALGATRGRLLGQCAVDGLVLATAGGILGLITARGGIAALLAFRPASLSRLDAAHIDANVLIFTGAIVLGWGMLFSLAPLSEIFRTNVASAFQPRGTQAGRSRIGYRTRATLVLLQVALSVVLLVSAVLLLRGFLNLQRADIGFQSHRVLSFKLPYFSPAFQTPDAASAFSTELRRSLAALPGVKAVGGISHVPYDEVPNWGGPYLPEGKVDVSAARIADTRSVTPGFFETVGATLLEGRYFTDDDIASSRRVAIVDQRLAERTWPGSAIGRRMRADPLTSGDPSEWVTVVGVVKHLRHRRATAEMNEQIYFPIAQAPRHPLAYMIRADGDVSALGSAVRAAVRQSSPHLPVFDMRPLDDYVARSRATQRFTIVLASAFAAVALLLACVGVYGLTAYGVTLRRQEFGLRLALGARPGQVLTLVLREGARMAVAGLGIGLAGAAAAAFVLRHQLIGVTPADPVSYASAIAVLMLAAVVASWAPARRAMRVSPLESLRMQ